MDLMVAIVLVVALLIGIVAIRRRLRMARRLASVTPERSDLGFW